MIRLNEYSLNWYKRVAVSLESWWIEPIKCHPVRVTFWARMFFQGDNCD